MTPERHPTFPPTPVDEGGLSIGKFVTAVRERSRIVWVCVFLALLVACAAIIIPAPLYTISYVAYPSTTSQDKSLGSTLSSLAGPLAGLIGSSATSDVQPFDIYMELIVSKRLSERMIKKDPEILQKIFYKGVGSRLPDVPSDARNPAPSSSAPSTRRSAFRPMSRRPPRGWRSG